MIRTLISVFFLFPAAAFAQSVSPDGEQYVSPGRIGGYEWYSGVSVADPDAALVLYDGKRHWEVDTPMACFEACGAFLSCHAFLYIEPKYKHERPKCMMLAEATDFVVARGTHLYLESF